MGGPQTELMVAIGCGVTMAAGYGVFANGGYYLPPTLITRITGIRRQLSRELGFVVPMIRVKDNLALEPNQYRITIAGVVVGEDEIWPDDLLALGYRGLRRVRGDMRGEGGGDVAAAEAAPSKGFAIPPRSTVSKVPIFRPPSPVARRTSLRSSARPCHWLVSKRRLTSWSDWVKVFS